MSHVSPTCHGLCCPRRHLCERYAADDFSRIDVVRMRACPDWLSMFLPMRTAYVASVRPPVERRE